MLVAITNDDFGRLKHVFFTGQLQVFHPRRRVLVDFIEEQFEKELWIDNLLYNPGQRIWRLTSLEGEHRAMACFRHGL